jgi:hypothetical protein
LPLANESRKSKKKRIFWHNLKNLIVFMRDHVDGLRPKQ